MHTGVYDILFVTKNEIIQILTEPGVSGNGFSVQIISKEIRAGENEL